MIAWCLASVMLQAAPPAGAPAQASPPAAQAEPPKAPAPPPPSLDEALGIGDGSAQDQPESKIGERLAGASPRDILDSALEDMRRGQADLMTGLARTAEREQYIDYLQSAYHAYAPRLYGSPQRAASIRDYAQLTGLRIGYVLQSAYFEPFDSDPALTKIGVKNEEQLLQMQLRGRIEVLIGTDCQVDFQLRDPQLAGQLVKLAYQPPQQTLLFIGLSRASPRLAERERLSAALQALLREGWLERAAQRYR